MQKHLKPLKSDSEYSKKHILTESATDKFIDKLIFNKLPDQLKQYTNTPVNELIAKRPDLVNAQSLGTTQEELEKMGTIPLKDFIRLSISKMFDIGHGKGPKKYLRGIFRIVLDEINYLQHPDQNAIQNLKNDVMYVMQASQNGSDDEAMRLDGNFNGLSGSQLHNMFKEKRKAFAKSVRDKVSSMFGKGGKSDYKVVPILKHEDAMKYAPYTGWCITYESPANYDNYVQGGRRFYIFLRNGFENVEERVGKGCPMDEYGLSMISVLVDMEGNIDYITTRWNHDHDGEFHNPDTETIQVFQNIIGMDLYSVCKPYSREELKAMGITPFDEVQELLDSGVEPSEIFSVVGIFSEGVAKVKLNGKYNFINAEGKLLSEQWFDEAYKFFEGFARINLNGKYNFINAEGKLLSERWFDGAWHFSEGFARVVLCRKWNHINKEGKILSEQWFDDTWSFSEGFAVVVLDGKYNFINTEGDILFEQWFDGAGSFSEGVAKVKLNGKYNYINTEGKFLSEQWFDDAWKFSEGFARVELNGKYRKYMFIDKNGKLYDYNKRPITQEGKHHKNVFVITEKQKKMLTEWFDSSEKLDNVERILFLYNEDDGCFDIDTCFDYEGNDMRIYPGVVTDEEIIDMFGEGTLDAMKKTYEARKGKSGLMSVFVEREEEQVDVNDINAVNERLKKMVKQTGNWHVCGWILTDGAMLSYDVGNGTRGVDHNQYITSIDGLDKYKFAEMGAIRCFPEDRICRFQIRKEPTDRQYYVLKNIFMSASGVELDLGDGDKMASYATFDENNPEIKRIHGNPWNLIDTIKSFYSGEKRYSSEVSRFHEGKEKKIFRLTESQVNLLMEALTPDELRTQYYNDIDKNVFNAAVKADPTSKPNHPGKYTKWLLNLVRNGLWKPGDTYETKKALTLFSKFGRNLDKNDINQYKSVGDLLNTVSRFSGMKTQSETKKEAKKDASKVYEDDTWLIVVPHTEEAAKLYGKGTMWCTAADNDNMFDEYNNEGPLYININKKTGEKFQFHFESGSFMNEYDEPVGLSDDVGLSEGAVNYYRNQGKKIFDYDYIGYFDNDYARVKNEDGLWNIINERGDPMSDEWFDEINQYSEGTVEVKKDGKYNLLDIYNGYMLSNVWFDDMEELEYGLYKVKKDRKYNIFDSNASDYVFGWMDAIEKVWRSEHMYSLSYVYKSLNANKFMLTNIFDTSTGLRFKHSDWFDEIGDFEKGFAKVKNNGKYNYLRSSDFDLLLKSPMDYITDFSEGHAYGKDDGVWYDINIDGTVSKMDEERQKFFDNIHLDKKRNESLDRKVFKITESQANSIIDEEEKKEERLYSLLNESFHPKSSMVLRVKEYLDRNFKKASVNDIDNNGYPSKEKVVVWINSDGEAVKTINMSDLLDLLDDMFHDNIKDDRDRKNFLKSVIIDWYNGDITLDGLLSKNTIA